MRFLRSTFTLLLFLFILLPASAATVRVFAAASLTEAFQEIGAAYQKAHPGDTLEFNFAGSQVLRTQIEQGAPADVFASADTVQMDALRKGGLAAAPRVFAHNRLVVVTPAGHAKVRRLADLARPGMKIVVAGSTVPVGRYTTQVIAKMSAAGLYGDDFAARVQANVVSQETNVRAVLSKVALGEADAGFVYVTDAETTPGKVRMLAIPTRMNVVATYPIAAVAKSGERAGAEAFVRLVLSPTGQAVLRKFGFLK